MKSVELLLFELLILTKYNRRMYVSVAMLTYNLKTKIIETRILSSPLPLNPI